MLCGSCIFTNQRFVAAPHRPNLPAPFSSSISSLCVSGSHFWGFSRYFKLSHYYHYLLQLSVIGEYDSLKAPMMVCISEQYFLRCVYWFVRRNAMAHLVGYSLVPTEHSHTLGKQKLQATCFIAISVLQQWVCNRAHRTSEDVCIRVSPGFFALINIALIIVRLSY